VSRRITALLLGAAAAVLALGLVATHTDPDGIESTSLALAAIMVVTVGFARRARAVEAARATVDVSRT
jgi:hypothetical protein